MKMTTRKEGNDLVVEVSGRMDALTAPEFEKKMRQLMDQGRERFVVDMQQVDYISSAGLRSVLVISKALKAGRGRLLLAGLADAVREVFEMTGFDRILEIYPTVAAAMEKL